MGDLRMSEKTTYFVMAHCQNCGDCNQYTEIQKGTPITDIACRFCGCKKLRRIIKEWEIRQ